MQLLENDSRFATWNPIVWKISSWIKFPTHASALACFIKWFFTMYPYNFVKSCSVHLFDLSNLEFTAPSLYEKFNTGKRLCKVFHAFHHITFMSRTQWENKRTWWSDSSIEQTWSNWPQRIGDFWSRTCPFVKWIWGRN